MSRTRVNKARIIVMKNHSPYKKYGVREADDAKELVEHIRDNDEREFSGVKAVIYADDGDWEEEFDDVDEAVEWINSELNKPDVDDLRNRSPVTVTMLKNRHVAPRVDKRMKRQHSAEPKIVRF